MPYTDIEKRKDQRRKWYLTHKEEHIARVLAYKKSHPEIIAKVQRKFNYGITEPEYQSMLAKQENKCCICLISFEEVKPCVDHDHITKVIRGILCNNCNVGLGRFKDSSRLLIKAIRYLEGTYRNE